MLGAYGKLVYRFKLWFLLFGLFCMAGGLIYASGIFSDLKQSGFTAPNSQSQIVDTIVKNNFGGNKSSLILLFSSKKYIFTEKPYARAAETIIYNIASLPVVNSTSSYYSTASPQFVSKNPHLTYAVVGLKGNANQQANEVAHVLPWIKSKVLNVKLGGAAAANQELTSYVQSDLKTAEEFSFPVTAILLLIIFGSLTAASLPLALGLYGIIGALFISRLVTLAIPMSVYVLDIVSLLGLGLGIDYSLFIVSRYREELNNYPHNEEKALCRTISTAGKTVIFSGLTVMIAVAGLIIFPIDYIRSMGVGGAAAVLIAVVGSLLFLPAILAMLGPNVNSLKVSNIIPLSLRRKIRRPAIWEPIAKGVLKHPLATIVFTLALLLLAGSPFLKVNFITSSSNILPQNAQARIVATTLNTEFKYGNQSPIDVVVPAKQIKSKADITAYVNKILSLPDAAGLGRYQLSSGYLLLAVLPKSGSMTPSSQNLVKNIRSSSVDGIRGMVGGEAADLLDLITLIRRDGLYAVIVVMLAMMVLFYLLLGSIVIPLKTIILTTLSLSSAFGVLVWIFQEGNLNSWLGISRLDGIDASQLVIIFSLAFGLSMDYATFLFSRIRESFSEHADMSRAIVWGVQRTGRIITSAAILLLAVIGSFATGRVVSMKEVAIGLIVAVVVDVFVVRLLLVPASMKLLGRYNWWLPGPLQSLYEKIKFRDD